MLEKETLRSHLLSQRSLFINTKENSILICNKIIRFLEKKIKKNIVIALYYPSKNEVSLSLVWEYCWNNKLLVLLPKVVSSEEMVFCPFLSSTKLQKGRFHIPEPDTEPYEDRIDIIFVPGLAFDVFGMRLGYGAGYYDRFLKKQSIDTVIGVCDHRMILEKLPTESHDYKMDLVFTDKMNL